MKEIDYNVDGVDKDTLKTIFLATEKISKQGRPRAYETKASHIENHY
jgi:hypothetical protein